MSVDALQLRSLKVVLEVQRPTKSAKSVNRLVRQSTDSHLIEHVGEGLTEG